ncbi:glycosidase crf1 [Penicillium paradoxum]|uniref:glycosidase crf1 n=1 Tax=Penicillium paradoxum TaxID=176176 RepID=UPI002548E5E4|nr:glycosidase crf1 [Penicillium paradoxum]KAJ5781281.1 glycosidase crf1 [Penicillium paradoxum]
MKSTLFYVALAAILCFVFAETSPDCNAFTKTCPSNKGVLKTHLHYDLTQASALDEWTNIGGAVITGPDGAEFTIHKQGDGPTIVTDFYIFYGEVSVEMKASSGTGIVSSVYMLSDANDEIDWEALGGFGDKIQTDYFGKGDTSEDYNRWTWQPVTTPQEVFHKYTWVWSKDKLSWAIDGNIVRTVDYADAKGGSRYPQTPMRVRIGIWAGGDSSRIKGTIDWAGGKTDYTKAPFTMYVKSVEIVNYNPAESYSYSDKSGSSDSIEIQGSVSSTEILTSTMSGTSIANDVSLSSSSTSVGLTTNSVDSTSTLLASLSSADQTVSSHFSPETTSSMNSDTSVATAAMSTPMSSTSAKLAVNDSTTTGTLSKDSSLESWGKASSTIPTASAVFIGSSTITPNNTTVFTATSSPSSAEELVLRPHPLVSRLVVNYFLLVAIYWYV